MKIKRRWKTAINCPDKTKEGAACAAESGEKNLKKDIHVALVGYGLAGATFHAPLIKTVPGLNLRFIVARSDEKQTKARKDHPSAEVLSDFNKLLLRSSEIDLAVIATTNKEHAPQALACLKAGIPVVVDKPIALNSFECEKLLEEAKACGVALTVFQNRRWDNDFLTVREIIKNGRLGKILRFESRFERYRPTPRANSWREKLPSSEGGGILLDLGSHLIDQATQLFGQPERIYAELDARRDQVESEDDSFLALSFPSGVKAHLWMSAISASQGHRFRVLGSEGAYEKYGLDPQEDALRAGKSPADGGWGVEADCQQGTVTKYRDGEKIQSKIESTRGCYQQFYEQMRDYMLGICPIPVNPADALLTAKIIEAAQKSAREKIELQLSP